MGALLLGIALAVLALAWVLAPLLRGAVPPSPEGTAPPLAEGPTALDVLREIEFDHATGKLAAEDYAKLRAEYTPRAVAELEASDARAVTIEGSRDRDAAAHHRTCRTHSSPARTPVLANVLADKLVQRQLPQCGREPRDRVQKLRASR